MPGAGGKEENGPRPGGESSARATRTGGAGGAIWLMRGFRGASGGRQGACKPCAQGRPPADDFACLKGILYVLREGCRWQKLPAAALGSPSGSTCWRRFRDWTQAGVWDKAHRQLLDLLGEEGLLDLQHVIIDSASTRAQKGGRTPARPPWTAARRAASATC